MQLSVGDDAKPIPNNVKDCMVSKQEHGRPT